MNKYAQMADRLYDQEQQMKRLEKENTELKVGRDINVFTKQLTKAKELLKEVERLHKVQDDLQKYCEENYLDMRLYKEKLTYAKTIIQDLLNNSDEYARQRAIDFLKE